MDPRIAYGYEAAAGSYKDALELAANLKTITDPIGGTPRVTFTYGVRSSSHTKQTASCKRAH